MQQRRVVKTAASTALYSLTKSSRGRQLFIPDNVLIA